MPKTHPALTAFAILVFLVLLAPLVIILGAAVSDTSYLAFPPQGFTFHWFTRLFEIGAFRRTMITSFGLAIFGTGLSLLIGIPAAYALARWRQGLPKFLPNADGSVGERNAVSCGSIEHKMGIHGNATCVMNFDGATGFLIVPANKGLNCMFTFMNTARLGTALQGLAHAEIGFQGGIKYARERLQMRSLTGPKAPDKPADPIIVHPDVRRMLLTMKAFAEGNRAMVYFTAKQVDIVKYSQDEEERKKADALLAFMTPIAKAFMTEVGFEAANHGVQIYGGHGFIAEWGMEQNVRDSRISMLYEGTTGIQALDLLGRKVLMTQGEALKGFTKIVHKFCQANEANEAVKEFVAPLAALNKEWGELTMKVGMAAMKDREEVGAASVDYLMFSGYACLAYFWADIARLAAEKLAAGTSEEAFYTAKLQTARFYFQRILPRTRTHVATMLSGANNLMAMDEEHFGLSY